MTESRVITKKAQSLSTPGGFDKGEIAVAQIASVAIEKACEVNKGTWIGFGPDSYIAPHLRPGPYVPTKVDSEKLLDFEASLAFTVNIGGLHTLHLQSLRV